MKKLLKFTLCSFLLTFLIQPILSAENSPFKLDPVKDGILFGSGVLLSGGDLLLDNVLKVNRQEYKGKIYDKDDVNAFDRPFMNSYSHSRDKAADFLLAATMATPGLLVFTDQSEWITEAAMYAETLLIANGIKEMIKLAVTRPRPYMYYDPSTFPEDDIDEGDWANSFPSGHSTIAFASATFTSYTFSKYFPESKWRIPVTAGAYSMAIGVVALRLSSGNHFMTDVLAGATIGGLSGFLVPWLHTFNQKHDVNLALLGNGFSVSLVLN